METATGRKRIRRGLVRPFFLLLLLVSFRPGFAQSGERFLKAEWKEGIQENQRFTLKVITPYPGKQRVSVTDPVWPAGIQKVSGPYSAQLTMQKEDGSFGTVLQVIYTLRSGRSGIFSVPPIRVTPVPRFGEEPPPEGALSTEELFIPILRNDEKHLRFPLVLGWESLPEVLRVGQSVPLVLIMRNMEEIDLPESVALPSPVGGILEHVEGLGDIGFSALSGRTLFNVPMDAWMLTPSREGFLTLPPAQVRIAGIKRSTPRRRILVEALPAEARSSGAVGDFSLFAELSASSVTSGGSLALHIRLEGTGNLNYLNMPEPEFPEGLAYTVREEADFSAAAQGFKGFREKVYTLRPEAEGRREIPIPSYSWYVPRTGRVETRPASRLSFEVSRRLSSPEEGGEYAFTLMNPAEQGNGGTLFLYRRPLIYLLFLPGLCFLVGLLAVKRFRPAWLTAFLSLFLLLSLSHGEERSLGWIDQARELFEESRYPAALELYREEAADWGGNGAYLYNRGVLAFLAGEGAEAVSDLRKAQTWMPRNQRILETLETIEAAMGLENQHRSRFFLHPDLLLILCLLGVNGALIALSYGFMRKTSLPVLFLLLFSTTALLSGGELLRSLWLLNRPLSVLREDGVMKKIPEEIAGDWLTLPEGTSLEYKKEEGGFMLVKTAYGLEGWIRREELLFLKDGPHEF